MIYNKNFKLSIQALVQNLKGTRNHTDLSLSKWQAQIELTLELKIKTTPFEPRTKLGNKV